MNSHPDPSTGSPSLETTHGQPRDRRHEWFVPTWGPVKLRIAIGLLFLPYTGMVLSFVLIGAMLAEVIVWERAWGILLVYFFGLGIAAHALDAIGGKSNKPWGEYFSRRQLWGAAIVSLILAYAIGAYYIVTATPNLLVIALLEGFFLFAYNLEWFGGRFHTDGWFALSWGTLPVLAGFVIQTNRISPTAVLFASAMGLFSLVEISASRPYKEIKRNGGHLREGLQYEAILKSVSIGVILLAIGMLLLRLSGK